MSGFYDVLFQFGDDLIPIQVPKDGTFLDLKRKYQEIFDLPVSQQIWGGRIGDLGVEDDVRCCFPLFPPFFSFLLCSEAPELVISPFNSILHIPLLTFLFLQILALSSFH